MPHLNSWQIMPVPPPTLPSATGPVRALGERALDVLGPHVKAVDVVEVAVPGLGHDGQRPPVAARVRGACPHAPGDGGIAHDTDAVRVREQHRSLELAGFLEPGRAGHLAVAVEREPAAEHRACRAWRGRAAGSRSRPVRTLRPSARSSISVTWPTVTPATSVMAFNGPGVPSNGTPRSRARGSAAPTERRQETAGTRQGCVTCRVSDIRGAEQNTNRQGGQRA